MVKLGLGQASGMFYHAPAGTALPTTLGTIPSAWESVGDVSNDGITLALDKTTENIRNWANVIRRVIMTEHAESIQAPIIDSSEEVFKVLVGEDNVVKTGTTISVSLSEASLPEEEAFLFCMKDGDDLTYIGCTNGQITAIDNVSFQPGGAVTWTPTITGLGDGWKLITSAESESTSS